MFHKDSMKIARDFITGEMSVNKNEYKARARRRVAREKKTAREERQQRVVFLFVHLSRPLRVCALSFFFFFFFRQDSCDISALDDGRRFESAISRRTRKLRRLDHSERVRKRAVLAPGAFIFSLRLRDSATIAVEISREIGRREMGIDPRVNGRTPGNYYNEPYSRIFTI